MMQSALIAAGLATLAFAAWHWSFLRFNRRRAARILSWLEAAIAPNGKVSAIEWLSSSHFRARLQLSGYAFRQPCLVAHLAPREMPVRWAMWRWRHRQETLTFEANLTCPPQRSIEIGRTRWTGLTRRWTRNTGTWATQPLASLFISTLPEWEPEIAGRMTGVVSSRDLEFLAVSFRPRPPQFSVTFSLQETVTRAGAELAIIESLRELSESSPTSRM
jgi:hypothetical protein